MKAKEQRSLYHNFISLIFITFLLSGSVFFLFSHLMRRMEWYLQLRPNPHYVTLIFLITLLITDIVVILLFSRRYFHYIDLLRAAVKTVATGNFKPRLPDTAPNADLCELNRDFNIMVSSLGSMETLRSDFVTNVSHEFKTPLAIMEGNAALLTEENDPVLRKEYAALIIESSRQLSAMVGTILELAKLENGTLQLTPSYFSLDEQLRQCFLMLEQTWTDKGMKPDIALDEVTICADAELLSHIWLNLYSNAIKYTPYGGTIGIGLTTKDTHAIVTVSDTGCGIPPADLGHIFDKFYQCDRSHSQEGNGLGLSLVKTILNTCNGRIDVWSTPGKGTTFTVTLPLK